MLKRPYLLLYSSRRPFWSKPRRHACNRKTKYAPIAHARFPVLEIVLALRKHGLCGIARLLEYVRFTRAGALVQMHEVICDALKMANERASEEDIKSKACVAACNSVHTLIPSCCRLMRCHWGAMCNLYKARRRLQFRMKKIPDANQILAMQQFRVLLLRKLLRLPPPLAPKHCHCRGQLDPWGDHRAACAGVLTAGPSRLRGRWPVFAARRGPVLPKTSVWPT